MKESLSEDLGRSIPENKKVERMTVEVMAMMSRARKV
jgi:hypothetical protein